MDEPRIATYSKDAGETKEASILPLAPCGTGMAVRRPSFRADMIRSARLNTVCPERVRTKVTDRRRRKFRPETLRPMNGRLRKIKDFSCGLWRVVDP